jgi:glycosyltransferase involved in cell wall biosynthesis
VIQDPSDGLRVRQIVASVDEEAAGPSYSVLALSAALRALGHDCTVLAAGRRAPAPGLEIFAQDMAAVPVADRLMMSRGLARAVDAAAGQGAVLHAHGLWLAPNLYPARAARRHGVPLLVSPRGMLASEALAFSRTRKRVVWALGQRGALETAACFHATAESEVQDIRRAGLTAPVAVIPNGIDIPAGDPAPGARTVLHLGRLHPKKGIDRLVAAWVRVADRHPDWRLRIVGPSEVGYREELERQVRDLHARRVMFEGPLFGSDKLGAYRQSGLFVLPTLNENFGLVVAEALAAGIPVISTKGAPWSGLVAERCGWWVDHGADAMEAALDAALSLPDAELYAWCLGKGDRPDYVVMD